MLYNYCVIYKCRTLDEETNRLFVDSCEGNINCKPHYRHNLLEEFKRVEESVSEIYDIPLDNVKVSLYNYCADHPLEVGCADYGFVVADLKLAPKDVSIDNIKDIIASLGALIETYAGSLFVTAIRATCVDFIYRNEIEEDNGRYRLYGSKYISSNGFREEVFKKKKKNKCAIC